jgi:hypothetical protein
MVVSSTKSLPAKLFIKENYHIILVNAPDEYQARLTPLPEGVLISTSLSDDVDFIQVFFMDREELEQQLSSLIGHLKQDGWLWISYPKGSSKIKTDINRDSIWEYAKGLGLKAVHQISIDETWSAMRYRFE